MIIGNHNKGFVALISILIASAVSVAVVTSVLLLGVGSSKTRLAVEQSSKARSLTDTCAEIALENIRENSSYSGSVSLSLGDGLCLFSVALTNGIWTINASGTVGAIVRRAKVVVTSASPKINVSSWQEVADF